VSELKAHPLALEYERISQAEADFITADMKANGYDETWPIVLYEKMILDGVTRQQCADAAGVRPCYMAFAGSMDEAKAFVRRANLNRRHLTEKQQTEKRTARIERIVEARVNGQSTHAIAAKEGVSQTQISRDLETAQLKRGVSADPVGNIVVGRDGKRQPAKRKKTTPPPVEADVGDAYEDEVAPSPLMTLAAAPTGFAAVEPDIAKFKAAVKQIDELKRTISEMATQPSGRYLRVQSIHIDLDNARRAIRFAAPGGVCRHCKGALVLKGKECAACRGQGWQAKLEFESKSGPS